MIDLQKHVEGKDYLKLASETAGELGVKLYIVGGYVRDLLLGKEKEEIDFLVVGKGPEFANELANRLGVKTITIFKNFGTAHFKFADKDFEFVGARKESYNRNSRNPVVDTGTFEDDINRRDFTINALTLSLNKEDFGKLIDSFDGLSDLEEKMIKTPLDPMITFDDDPLRIMRAFRFAAKLNFTVDEKIMEASLKLRERLKIVSIERITEEFLKTLSADKPSIGLNLLQKAKVFDVIFPEMADLAGVEQRKDFHHKDVFYHTCEVIDNIAQMTDDVWLRFAALVHDIAKPRTKKFDENVGWTFHGHEELGARMMKKIFKRMKLPFTKLEYIEKLVRLHLRPIALVNEEVSDSAIRRFIVQAGEDMEDLIKLCRADITSKNPEKVHRYLENYDLVMDKVREVQEKDELRAFQSPVRGDEIMKICNLKPGRKVGEIKTAIEDAILDGVIPNNYEAAYEYLLKVKDEILNK